MKIFLLGGSGTIGGPLASEFLAAGHDVLCLARSHASEQKMRAIGADVIRGDLRAPELWAGAIRAVDVCIHAAATFTEDMGDVDHGVVRALIEAADGADAPARLIYTGGCWLYGETGDESASEETPLDPIGAFAWMVEHARMLERASAITLNVVHPAIVYAETGGAFARFEELAAQDAPIEVWGSLETRWPVVHAADLAVAYRLVAERGVAGEAYNVAAQAGVPVRDIVDAMKARFGARAEPTVRSAADVVADHGDWAVGPTLDQHMRADKISRNLGWSPIYRDAAAFLRKL